MLTGNRILITGATGLAGEALARNLRAAGWPLRLVRRQPPSSGLGAGPDELVIADLLRTPAERMEPWFAGIAAVVHAAGRLEESAPGELEAIHVETTRRLVEASRANPPARFVLLSSVSVYGEASQRGTEETAPLRPQGHYARCKVAGEEVLRAGCAEATRPLIFRPCALYGRRDRRWAPCLRALAHEHRIPLLRGGRVAVPLLHVDDLARAVAAALRVERPRHTVYNLANEDGLTWGRLVVLLGEILGVRVRTTRLPLALARPTLRLGEFLAARSGGRLRPYLERWIVEMAAHDRAFSTRRARADLGWRQEVSAAEGLRAALSC